jgi:hypothetical protein
MGETAVEKWDRHLGLKQCPLYTSLMFDLTSLWTFIKITLVKAKI